jgi:glucose 1-dehydrogenase
VQAVVVTPGKKDSLRLEDHEVPTPGRGELLLKVLKVGICGTDRDIIEGFYGEAPAGSDYLVLGHESICRVHGVGDHVRGFRKGELVVPTVRRNCPENCLSCRSGQSDMCLTGHYREHGIKRLHGFAREFAVTDRDFVVKLPEPLADLGVLLEPTAVVEKGVVQTYRIQEARMTWKPRNALVLGAGPVGLLATAILRLKGLEVHTVATRPEESLKARLVRQTGAEYVDSKKAVVSALKNRYDMVFEATGSTSVALQAQNLTSVNGIVSYLGIYRQERSTYDAGKGFTDLVLGNRALFGSVNANVSYFLRGAKDLPLIERKWKGFLARIITKRASPAEDLSAAYAYAGEDEIKTVIEFKV